MDTLESLKEALSSRIKQDEYDVWIRKAEFVSFLNGSLTIYIPNVYYSHYIKDNYERIIVKELARLTSLPLSKIRVAYKYPPPSNIINKKSGPSAAEPEKGSSTFEEPILNPRMTFENFVVGPFNNFAHSVSLKVSREPGKVYNPLVIYGGIGLGKTHLLNSIGHSIIKDLSGCRVCYITAEEFLNEFRNSYLSGKIDLFHQKFRRYFHVLLMDDFQALGGGKKESAQFEIINTFNSFYQSNRQLVFAIDTPLQEIRNIEKKLINRLECGLIADIKVPDLETKVNIIRKKAEYENIQIPHDAASHIAKTSSNIREIEGKVLRLAACANFYGETITLSLCKKVLSDIVPQRFSCDAEKIKEVVCNYFNLKPVDLASRKKKGNINTAKQVAIYLCKKHTKMTLVALGESFGGKGHSTILHSLKTFERKLDEDKGLHDMINSIEKDLLKTL